MLCHCEKLTLDLTIELQRLQTINEAYLSDLKGWIGADRLLGTKKKDSSSLNVEGWLYLFDPC
jgi:hypothetical protein